MHLFRRARTGLPVVDRGRQRHRSRLRTVPTEHLGRCARPLPAPAAQAATSWTLCRSSAARPRRSTIRPNSGGSTARTGAWPNCEMAGSAWLWVLSTRFRCARESVCRSVRDRRRTGYHQLGTFGAFKNATARKLVSIPRHI